MKKILIGIVAVLAIGFAGLYIYDALSITLEQSTANVGTGIEYAAEKIVSIENGTILPGQTFSFSSIGTNQIGVKVKAEHLTVIKEIDIEVKDLVPPTITFQHQESTEHPGGALDTWWYSVSDDNSPSSMIRVKTEGHVDAKTAGEYDLTVIATDEAGNTAKATGHFIVTKENSSSSSSTERVKCTMCNGTGYVKYYYGSSDLEAVLSGNDPYTYGKCSSCNGTGYTKYTQPSDGSYKVCGSCGKKVSKLITKKDNAGVSRTWCSDCWDEYDAIMGN